MDKNLAHHINETARQLREGERLVITRNGDDLHIAIHPGRCGASEQRDDLVERLEQERLKVEALRYSPSQRNIIVLEYKHIDPFGGRYTDEKES